MTVILDSDQALAKLQALPRPHARQYLAMYSSVWAGIVRDPWLMVIPIDDHIVHRGDGVFDAIRCEDGALYELDRHLERLWRSAASIALNPPLGKDELKELAKEVVRAGNHPNCLLRIYISRGPGSLNANPSESVGPQLYMVACLPHAPSPEAYTQGVKVGFSYVPIKLDFYAQAKSCSYLLNVLVKQDALKNGWDYPLWTSPEGVVSEGATENFILLNQNDELIFPDPGRMVEGITVRRTQELALELKKSGQIKEIAQRMVTVNDLKQAKEIMILSTSLNVVPVASLEGRPVGQGRPGEVAQALLALIKQDIKSGARSTRVW